MNAVCHVGANAVGGEIVIHFAGALGDMELMMAIADWVRERTAKERAKFAAEIYAMGYDDGAKGKERQFPKDAPDKPGKNGKSE